MTFIILGVCLFVGFLFLFLLLTQRQSAAGALLQEVTRPSRIQADMPAWRTAVDVDFLAKPFTLVRSLFAPEPDPQLVRRLMLAGYRNPASADIFLGARLAFPAVFGVLVALLVSNNTIMYFIIAVGVGFFLPDFWLNWSIKKRRERIRLSLPDGLDFLAICLEAGLGLDQGIIRLGQELGVSHPALADRVDLEMVRSFVAMLIQTDRFGTPLSKSLGTFSDALRTQRRQKAEEMAAKTTIKLLFPLALFIAPAMGIVLLGPAALSLVKNFKHMLG